MNNKVILGTVQFGLKYGINNSIGQMSEEEVFKILDLVRNSNINVLDTAPVYGSSEQRIGNYIQSQKVEEIFKIITKFNIKQGATHIQSLESSLENLKVKQVDTIMFHNFDDYKTINNQELEELRKLKGSNYLKLGISLYTNEEIDEICETNLFDVVQIPFNALDNQRLRRVSILKLKSKDIEIHTRSVFLQGLFFMDLDKIPQKLKPLVKYLKKIDIIAKEFFVEKSALVLHYVFSKLYIDGVLIGVDSLYQMKKNIEMLRSAVPSEAINALDEIVVIEKHLLNPSTWNH